MDIKKFELNLKKINTLQKNIDLSGEEISKLEIQLLKNYIQKMYEALSMEEEEEEEEFEIVRKKKKKKKIKEVFIEEEELIEEEEEEEEEEESPAEEEVAEVVEEIPQPAYDEVLLSLFESANSTELSDKLSSLPIQDIKKAIGINDRIFTINELFGGDKELFNSTVEQLNGMDTFEQAKNYLLEHIAVQNEWSREDNIKKAKRFVKIVKRRFSVN
jgi:hypothetical protein